MGFTYGQLWSLKEFEQFEKSLSSIEEQSTEPSQQLLVAHPSASFFPEHARKIIMSYFEKSGLKNPSLFMLQDASSEPAFQEAFPTEKDDNLFYQRLRWFLPRHYKITKIEKNSDLRQNFKPI